MLRLFFNRFSKVVYGTEILGVGLTAVWGYQQIQHPPPVWVLWIFVFYLLEYLVLRFLATKRWYRDAQRYSGIELQFKKAMIPVSYTLAFVAGISLLTGTAFLLGAGILIFSVVLYVHATLLYLHFRDKNKIPVNYFSHNKYLQS